MHIDEKFLKEFVKVTQQASIATLPKIGKKNKNEVDKLATDAMRKVLNNIEMKGRVVIGEGEIDEAPMLYIGEILGNNDGPEIDIAVDPLEGTNFAANNLPGALSVIAVSYKNNLLNAPETYMNKIAYGSDIEKGVIDLDYDFSKNISFINQAVSGYFSVLEVYGKVGADVISSKRTVVIELEWISEIVIIVHIDAKEVH